MNPLLVYDDYAFSTFMNKIIVVNDPYGFRLLVMGSNNYMKIIEKPNTFKIFKKFGNSNVVL